MKKSDQVAPYFLYDLDKIRVFIELSERHSKEKSIKYNESDLETDEATCWDRYKYRNDLSAHFDSIFPQYQKQSYLVMLETINLDSQLFKTQKTMLFSLVKKKSNNGDSFAWSYKI